MRRDELYLLDIVEASDAIRQFLVGAQRERFVHDELLRSAVLHKLTIIGEAAARLSAELREQHAEIEWADVVGFRNLVVHAYFAIEWPIVWVAATQDAPELRRQIAEILVREYPDVAVPHPGE